MYTDTSLTGVMVFIIYFNLFSLVYEGIHDQIYKLQIHLCVNITTMTMHATPRMTQKQMDEPEKHTHMYFNIFLNVALGYTLSIATVNDVLRYSGTFPLIVLNS